MPDDAAPLLPRTPGRTSDVRLVRAPGLTSRAPYAYAATTDHPVRLVLTAGACPLDADGATVAVGDVTGQAEQVMTNLRAALQAAGAESARRPLSPRIASPSTSPPRNAPRTS